MEHLNTVLPTHILDKLKKGNNPFTSIKELNCKLFISPRTLHVDKIMFNIFTYVFMPLHLLRFYNIVKMRVLRSTHII